LGMRSFRYRLQNLFCQEIYVPFHVDVHTNGMDGRFCTQTINCGNIEANDYFLVIGGLFYTFGAIFMSGER